jgi:hypothetical protein
LCDAVELILERGSQRFVRRSGHDLLSQPRLEI